MIVWLSDFPPLPIQLRELAAVFGEHDVVHVRPDRTTARDIAADFRESGAVEVVAVAPRRLIAALTREGLRPLWAQMDPCEPPGDLVYEGRAFRFAGFMRAVGAEPDGALRFAPVQSR